MNIPNNSDRFVGIGEVLQLTAIKSKSTIYDMMGKNKFPKSYAVTDARRAWSFNELQDWIADRKVPA